MLGLALSLLLLQATPQTTPSTPPASTPSQALGFFSQKFTYRWDTVIPLKGEVNGLKLNSIFFNRRELRSGLFRGADFGTRAQIEVTNTSTRSQSPSFAVAVFDEEERLLGVATGGSKFTGVGAGETEHFELNFSNVLARLPKGTSFVLSVELN